jgi:hypothetical protein
MARLIPHEYARSGNCVRQGQAELDRAVRALVQAA